MTAINTEFAQNLGREFAEELNATPAEAQNWTLLDDGDDVPEMDYIQLREHYDFVTLDEADVRSVERAYKRGFNSAFGG